MKTLSPGTYQAAAMYAAADKSDPFTYSRVVTHFQNGLSGTTDFEPDYYAEQTEETRITERGEEYKVPAYKNVKRV